MDVLFLGQNSSGKTSNIKKYLNLFDNKKIILDYSNQFDDFSENVLYIDDINPLMDELSSIDIMALNAGYLASSKCLYNKCLEVLEDIYLQSSNKTGQTFKKFSTEFSKSGLLEESIERLHISWDKTDATYGKVLNKKIPIKKQDKHFSLSSALEFIDKHDCVILKSKNMHSDQQRAITFIILSRLSFNAKEKISIVCDELSLFFNNGNITMFKDCINRTNLDFIVSFNKCSNIPKSFFPLFDVYYLHRFENNSEIKEIKKLGLSFKTDLKKLSVGSFVKLKRIEKEREVYA